jgi:hypothetical protein
MSFFGLSSGKSETRGDSIIIGSNQAKAVIYLPDPQIQGEHAEIYGDLEYVGGGQIVRMYIRSIRGGLLKIVPAGVDLDSPNYPFQDYRSEELRSGDRIVVGPYSIEVKEIDDPDLSDEESPYDFIITKLDE